MPDLEADPASGRPTRWLLRGARTAGCGRCLDVRWVDGLVESTGSLAPTPGDTVAVLDGAYLAPGLIDAHVHLSRGATFTDTLQRPSDAPGRASDGSSSPAVADAHPSGAYVNAGASLAAGITALRDLGARTPPRFPPDAQEMVELRGPAHPGASFPRVVFAGRALTRVGCYGGFLGVCAVDGDDLEARAEAEVAAGAGTLKVILTGAVDFASRSVGPPHFSEAELRRVARIARRADVPLAIHANGHEGVALALRVGADSVEHGILLDEEDLRVMASAGVRWVPTLTPLFRLRGDPRWPGLGALFEGHAAAVARGREMGVSVVAGSDAGSPGVPHPSLFTELALLRRAGFSPAEVGEAAGRLAAPLLGLRGGYGRLEPGARTDLVWFGSDPYAGDPGPPLGVLTRP